MNVFVQNSEAAKWNARRVGRAANAPPPVGCIGLRNYRMFGSWLTASRFAEFLMLTILVRRERRTDNLHCPQEI